MIKEGAYPITSGLLLAGMRRRGLKWLSLELVVGQALRLPQAVLEQPAVFEAEQKRLEPQQVVPQFFLPEPDLQCCLRVSGFFPPSDAVGQEAGMACLGWRRACRWS